MSRKAILALIISLVATLMLTGIAYAITITVDGVRESAWDGVAGQTPGSVSDPNESTITDGYDIARFQWTNDQTNMYFLIETYTNTITAGDPLPAVYVCMDTDNNTATGDTYANCNGMTGIDRSLSIFSNEVSVRLGAPLTTTILVGSGTRAVQTTISEISVTLSHLGFSAGTCPPVIPTAIYFDNGIADPDDNVPDSGTFAIGCGSPTAVTLDSLQAQPTTSPILPVALIGVSAAALIGVVHLTRRGRRKTA